MLPSPLPGWIALNLLTELGPLVQRRALQRFGDPAAVAHRVPLSQLRLVRGFTGKKLDYVREARRSLEKRTERELRRCERLGITPLPCGDEAYPAAFGDLPDAPVLIYMKGVLPEGVLRVAVVGSRACTAYGRRVATGLASGLAAREIEVVSGGARGIDTAAHRGALAEGGRTVAVVGSGLLDPYPAESGALFDEIAGQGTVISEFPLDEPPRPFNFLRRNRLISALGAAVVVVEAARRSGSLSTAGHALDQGREVLAVPGPVSSVRSEGCHRLIQQGAKLVQNIEDILDELSPMYRSAAGPGPSASRGPNLSDLTPDEQDVLRMMDPAEPIHLDQLADLAPFGVARLQAALFGLELRGAVEQSPGRYYLLRPRTET